MPIYNKSQAAQSIAFNGIDNADFDPVSALGINQVLATIQSIIPVPFDCKVLRVVVTTSGVVAAGSTTIQIATGTGAAPATTGTTVGADNVAPVGTILFATPPAITAANLTAGNEITFIPDNWDVIYACANTAAGIAGSGAFTLRFITNGTGGISLITKVVLLVSPVDLHSQATGMPSPLGNNTGFDPSMF